MGLFSKGLKNEFKIALVNEPSVFEPLKVYCISFTQNIGFAVAVPKGGEPMS